MFMLQNDKIEAVVIKIQRVYLSLTCLGFVLAVFVLSGLSGKYGLKDGFELTYTSFIYLALYFGLMRRKKWIIPLILLAAAFGLFRELIYILHPAESLSKIAGKAISVLLLLFYSYQMHFFSKTEVKKFFQSKGSFLF